MAGLCRNIALSYTELATLELVVIRLPGQGLSPAVILPLWVMSEQMDLLLSNSAISVCIRCSVVMYMSRSCSFANHN